jgi:O-antigen/teichoic acid export membrane protein
MTDSSNLKNQVLHSLKWVALGKVLTQVIRWAITFWVIRLLLPEDYGVVAMADVFFSFLTLFIGSLFTPALIQSKELTQKTLKQIFGMIIIVHASLFVLQIIIADAVGAYYQSEIVASILKVNAWCLLILAFEIIPAALLARNMEFKKVSIISAIANISAAITTLVMAYLGYGFWALIFGEIVSISLRTAMTLIISPIKYLPSFRFSEISALLKFGGLLTGHATLAYIFLHMDVAIAGRYMSAVEIGLFAIGLQFALMPQKKLLPLLKQVAFPAFSKIQDQPERINNYILKAQKFSLLITVPVFWGLASVVDLIIPIVLGEKWLEAVIPTMIILLVMPLRFCDELFGPALKSQRQVKHMMINLWVIIAIMLVSIFLGVGYGATGLAMAWAIGFPIAFIIVVYRNTKLFNIKLSAITKLFIAPCFSGLLMLLAVFGSKHFLIDISLVNLIIQIIIGGSVFLFMLFSFDKKSLYELKSLIKSND